MNSDSEMLDKIVAIYKERLAENPANKEMVLEEAYRNARLLGEVGLFQLAKEAYERILLVDPASKQAQLALAHIAEIIQ